MGRSHTVCDVRYFRSHFHRMAPLGVPDDVTDLDDPTVDVNAMVTAVGAESVATVQVPALTT